MQFLDKALTTVLIVTLLANAATLLMYRPPKVRP